MKYCLEHNRDYKGTANKYDVSYYQVYSWLKKYEISGEDGLLDKRGHHKKFQRKNNTKSANPR